MKLDNANDVTGYLYTFRNVHIDFVFVIVFVKTRQIPQPLIFFVTCFQVVLVGDSRGVTLAPYNVLFSGQSALLNRSNMSFNKKFGDIWVFFYFT